MSDDGAKELAGGSKSFKWLNATQFCGALNDNVFKLLIMFCLIHLGTADPSTVVASVGTVFVMPFLLFSHLGGVLADRSSKRNIIVMTKIAEVFVMTLGCLSFVFRSVPLMYGTCFLMSCQSAIFGPSKYGIVPELVPREKLAKSNGVLISLTFLAIVVGTPLAAVLSEATGGKYERAAVFCIFLAVTGTAAAFPIVRTPRGGGTQGFTPLFLRDIFRTLGEIRRDHYLFLAIISSAYFIMVAAFMQLNMIPYGMDKLGWSEERSSYLFLLAAIGIGIGSLLAGKLSGRNIEFGLVPVGAIGLTAMCILLCFAPSLISVGIGTFFAGMSIGFFTLPIDTFLQLRSPRAKLGRILAASSFVANVGVLIAAGLVYLTGTVMGLTAAKGFLVIGCVNLVLVVGTIIVLPDFLTRFFIILVTKLVYRIRVSGIGNVPVEGGALIVPNHVTLVDALLLSATVQRRIRFVMYRDIYDNARLLKPLLKLMRVIPISANDPPRTLVAALKKARAAMDEGYLVCVFAEGALTRNGHIGEFKAGFERIVKGSDYPVIPAYLGGAWGSIFSYRSGKPMTAMPKKIPYPVEILFGEPLPATSSAFAVRQSVCELSSQWFQSRKVEERSLGRVFIKVTRRDWWRKAMTDTTGKAATCGKSLAGAIALSGPIGKLCEGQEKVGVVLPTCVGAALTNIALTLLGKIPVNLNFTASTDAVRSAIDQCDIKTVISSRVFIEKLKGFEPPEGTVYLEDIAAGITGREKAAALLKAALMPASMFTGLRKVGPDDVATIIFSSGSTGDPKGVMLSHHNIISNIEAFGMVMPFTSKDNMCAALPFFHSFGFTTTLWCPFFIGFPVTYHSNPLDGEGIANAVREYRATALLATPTFLLAYIRRAKAEDFASLRFVITGAEKLRKKVADAFESRFGIRVLEGYGATELSPAVSVNVPDVDAGGVFQQGTRLGTIGKAIPGCAIKIVDQADSRELPPGEEGLMFVKGPNVMLGYLNRQEQTDAVLQDGWYETGDIARIEEDGFITITDRASRFSKIGGEMVPHIAVEDEFFKRLGQESRVIVVTGVPDSRKGEKLVVLYTDEAGSPEELQSIMSESSLPNLWRPRPENYIKIEELPILGTGKLDLKAIKQTALEHFDK